MNPRVSVVLAVYNATWCVGRALDSVLAQSRVPEEILICDDGSTDGTPDWIANRYGARVTVLRLPHRNAAATRRVGLEQATGDWLAFMDADDTWRPAKLERQLAFIERHPEVRWVSCDGALVSSDRVIRESWLADYFDPVQERAGDLLPSLIERCFPLMSSMIVEREAYTQVGGIRAEMVYSHDYDLWLRLSARYPGGLMSERLIEYFTHPGQLSRNIEERGRDDLAIMRRVENGELGHRTDIQRVAAKRAAALEFDLAIYALRAGHFDDARARLRRAAAAGPARRRAIAMCGAALPAAQLTWLMKTQWMKRVVQGSRRRAPVERAPERSAG
jgi:glycosyltransferase involved in cell wall biosynthesis